MAGNARPKRAAGNDAVPTADRDENEALYAIVDLMSRPREPAVVLAAESGSVGQHGRSQLGWRAVLEEREHGDAALACEARLGVRFLACPSRLPPL